ncbi:hypothetical protein YQE_01557, partial [Dendroctonus ponderosae]
MSIGEWNSCELRSRLGEFVQLLESEDVDVAKRSYKEYTTDTASSGQNSSEQAAAGQPSWRNSEPYQGEKSNQEKFAKIQTICRSYKGLGGKATQSNPRFPTGLEKRCHNSYLKASYRPIFLLNFLGKLTEKVILSRLQAAAELPSLIPDEQCGFRPRYNTTLKTARIVTDAYAAFSKLQSTVMLLLDMERAFDTVKVENSTFAKRRIAAELPQGTVISPLLYTLYTADIPKLPTTIIAQYADDTAIYASAFYAQAAKSRIAHHLSLLAPYFDKRKLKVTLRKTELIIFSRKFTSNKILSPLMVQNTPIKTVKEVKYLGFKLDARLHFNKHVDYAIQKTFMARRKLYSLLVSNLFLSLRNKLLPYTSTIRPILTYGFPIWHSVCDSTRWRVQRTQNRFLRGVLSADRDRLIADFIDTIAATFYHSGVQGSVLTRNITQVRANDRPTHGPFYKRLPIFYEDFVPDST